jgi:Holliday junction resolvasome RuvABC endonuclease subunit
MEVKLKAIEKVLGELDLSKPILGIDTATRTGWALISKSKDYMNIETGFFSIKVNNIYLKYNEYVSIFEGLIKPEYKVVIEDTYFRFNPYMFKIISRLGGIAYTLSVLKKCEVEYIMASSARKKVGIKGTGIKKPQVANHLIALGINIDDEDISDAIVLALSGAIKTKEK